jgi:hydrogenase 3 maturation protease
MHSVREGLAYALRRTLPPSRQEAGTVVVLGVGSELRADDAAGLRVAERVSRMALPGVHGLAGGSAPENFTGEIRRLAPARLLIVDAADMGDPPGSVRLIEPVEVEGISFSTHTFPLNVFAEYIARETGCDLAFIGIQPLSLEFDGALSPVVARAIEETAEAIGQWLAAR